MQNNYLPLYGGDYLRDTADLSLAEHGAYLLLLIAYWHRGEPIPVNSAYRIAGAIEPQEQAAVDAVLRRFFYADGEGLLRNSRMDKELSLRSQFLETQRERGKRGAAAKWRKNGNHMASAMASAMTSAIAGAKPNAKAAGMADAVAIPSPSPYPYPTPTPSLKDLVSPSEILVIAPERDDVPYARIVELYHQTLPMLPKCVKLTQARKAQIRQRWNGKDANDLSDWQGFFELVAKSKFLTGMCPANKPGGKPFVASLDWLTRESNFVKVIEGRYA